jgi:hypothetical protein
MLLLQIIVFFVNEEKLGAQKMMEYINRMKEDQIYRAVLILQKKLSGPANSERLLVKNTHRIEDVSILLLSNQCETNVYMNAYSVPRCCSSSLHCNMYLEIHVILQCCAVLGD